MHRHQGEHGRAPYRTRFAPSPTGPLHLGSLLAAVGSFLQARSIGGEWLVRIEDIDTLRNVVGADRQILDTLQAFGMQWDGDLHYQTPRLPQYQAALDTLLEQKAAYPCACKRKDYLGQLYPGTCRNGLPPDREGRSIRVSTVEHTEIAFSDRVQGHYAQVLDRDVGDFIIKRADGLFAYQLAVVVDDAEQAITEVVRGIDLLDSTPRQILLQKLLGYPTPAYLHLPIITNELGDKLSKQTGATAVATDNPPKVLLQVLSFLGQIPPLELKLESLEVIWQWAIANWKLSRIPRD